MREDLPGGKPPLAQTPSPSAARQNDAQVPSIKRLKRSMPRFVRYEAFRTQVQTGFRPGGGTRKDVSGPPVLVVAGTPNKTRCCHAHRRAQPDSQGSPATDDESSVNFSDQPGGSLARMMSPAPAPASRQRPSLSTTSYGHGPIILRPVIGPFKPGRGQNLPE